MNNAITKRILIAEDREGSGIGLTATLGRGYEADVATSGEEALSRLRQAPANYLAVVVKLSRTQAVWDTLRQIRMVDRTLPAVVLADAFTEMSESGCAKLGYTKVLWEPVTEQDLYRTLEECTNGERPEEAENCRRGPRETACGTWWAKIQPQILSIGASDVPVLVQGETGVGKEVVARQLHACSPRAKKVFLKVNCAALPSELIESELFGYERGAFTGAFKNNPGKFELADGGTIFLDEIGDMDFKLQAKLLQVLQDREFLRLGACEPRRVDVRVIAATHCDLERMMEEGRFREDLYYRLNIITIQVPPLRDRKDEILDLAYYFLQRHATTGDAGFEITKQVHEALLEHDWPGNVRELENVMRKLLVLRRPDLVIDDLRNRARRRKDAAEAEVLRTRSVREWRDESPVAMEPAAGWEVHNGLVTLETTHRPPTLEKVDQARREAETEAILNALNSTLWNRKRAAEILKIDYKALLYKMKKLGIAERVSRVAI
jgi:two-component system, NtrC family, response regulator AtoC